jgi:cytochrome P450
LPEGNFHTGALLDHTLTAEDSDTTAATLSWVAFELCNQPKIQAKLRKNIDAIAPSKSFLDVEDVANCAFLDGFINEVLRLHPAVRLTS